MDDRIQNLGESIWATLQRMVRELLSRKPGGHLVDGRMPEIDLHLPIVVQGPDAGPQDFARRLRAILDGQIEEAIAQAAAFRPGHAFCHRCSAADCAHSLPPSSRHVFIGYAPTGTPRWEEFAQFCLERRHPEVDRLYGDPPAFLTLFQDAGTLGAELLQPFQVETRQLLGQVTAGFFPLRTQAGEGRGVLALTLQVSATGPPGGARRLGLNILGRTPQGEDLGMLWERQDDLAWRRAVRWAQAALTTVGRAAPRSGRHAARPPKEVEDRVAGILRGLARRLEADLRARSRRTQHADHRHEAGDRPTRKAIDDVKEARSAAAYLVDERSGAMVILGERGRTHFFTPEGRLVSSVRYSRDAIERKRKLGLWRVISEAEAREFRDRVLQGGRKEREAPAP